MVMRPWLVLETGLELTCLIDKQLARLSTPREHRRQPGATREGRGRAHRQPPPTIKVRNPDACKSSGALSCSRMYCNGSVNRVRRSGAPLTHGM